MKKITFVIALFCCTTAFAQLNLPFDFESAPTTADFIDFDGGTASVIDNPQSTDPNTSTKVAQIIRNGGQVWAGSKIILENNLDFSTLNGISMKVFSPAAGITVKFKLEGNGQAEKDVLTTVANQWETLTWDFTGQPSDFNSVVFMFDFGNLGDGTANSTFLFDDVQQVTTGGGATQVDLPIDFEGANVNYSLVDFGGNASSIVEDPTDAANMVGQAIKTPAAMTWAGTTNGGNGLANPIPFAAGATTITVRVWSPDAGTPIRVKVEAANDPTISVETEATTTMAAAWETLAFDFSNQADGTAAINFANTYDKLSIFFNFGTDGATAGEKTYYWDDVAFLPGTGGPLVDLPITFEDEDVDYMLVDFGGNASSIVEDPTDAANMVGQAIKTSAAMTWAGTTNGGDGLANPIPFAAGATTITVRVWSPDAGTPIRVKVEAANDPTISVETEATTTIAAAWETLAFDFSNQADGTAAINFANTYDKLSIFFNFGTDGATAGEKTYYWDDVAFVPGTGGPLVDLPITFEDADVDYMLVDFGGNASSIVEDPTDAANMVGQAIKTPAAMTWAGTTNGGDGLANPIPFAAGATTMTVRVWSPDAGTPIRVKVEAANDPTISVETEATTTIAAAWETLAFDFSNQADGTAAINFANTYDKLSIFFNFGTDGATAGEKTYYWDDVFFGTSVGIKTVDASAYGFKIMPNPASDFIKIETPDSQTESLTIHLFDLTGKIWAQQTVNDKTTEINTSNLNSGSYILRIDSNTTSYFQKVMIIK